MASRRGPSEKSQYSEEERIITPARPATSSNTSPAVPTPVIIKLLIATFLMIAAPISIYFLTAATIFKNNNTWAGATAALTANVVLVGYIVVAVMEDQGEKETKVGKIE